VINPTAVPSLLLNDGSELKRARPTEKKEEFLKALAGGRTDFSGATMCGMTLTSVQLEGVDFSGADLSECLFENCTFDRCDFSGARLCNAQMKLESTFRNCVFNRANLCGTSIKNTHFSRVDFIAAEASEVGEVWETSFEDVSFSEAKLNLLFWQCEFRRANLVGADFSNAPFLSCTFNGPIDFQGCQGFEKVSDAILNDVNVLSLAQLPIVWRHAGRYENERLQHEAYRPLWKAVVEGRGEDEHAPMLRMTDRLQRYKAEIKKLDAPTRRYLREKVSLLMEFTPETSAASALFREIEKIDDAMTEKENAQATDDMLSGLCMRSGWSEEDTDRTVEADKSWRLRASKPNVPVLHHRRASSLGTVVDILEHWNGPHPFDNLTVDMSLQELSTSSRDFSEGWTLLFDYGDPSGSLPLEGGGGEKQRNRPFA